MQYNLDSSMSSVSNNSDNASSKRKWSMKEIDETDEILEDIESLIKNPQLKESKLRKHIIRDEKATFDSGDYYKKKDIEKKMGDDATEELQKQAQKMEQKVGRTDKKKKPEKTSTPKTVSIFLTSETRFRQCRVFHESRCIAEPKTCGRDSE